MTENSRLILRFLAEGCTIDEIFWHYPHLGYQDIYVAAREALKVIQAPFQSGSGQSRMEKLKSRYPKAFARWTDEEQELLSREFQAGNSIQALSELLNRQPGAIRIRLEKLGMIEPDEARPKRYPL